jgi:hypothetical protein
MPTGAPRGKPSAAREFCLSGEATDPVLLARVTGPSCHVVEALTPLLAATRLAKSRATTLTCYVSSTPLSPTGWTALFEVLNAS